MKTTVVALVVAAAALMLFEGWRDQANTQPLPACYPLATVEAYLAQNEWKVLPKLDDKETEIAITLFHELFGDEQEYDFALFAEAPDGTGGIMVGRDGAVCGRAIFKPATWAQLKRQILGQPV